MDITPLAQAIAAFGSEAITADNHWYDWKFDLGKLPSRVNVVGENDFQRNVCLKRFLQSRWLEGDERRRIELVDYYVAVWGGIKRNRPSTIGRYATNDPKEIISSGTKGVPSLMPST